MDCLPYDMKTVDLEDKVCKGENLLLSPSEQSIIFTDRRRHGDENGEAESSNNATINRMLVSLFTVYLLCRKSVSLYNPE